MPNLLILGLYRLAIKELYKKEKGFEKMKKLNLKNIFFAGLLAFVSVFGCFYALRGRDNSPIDASVSFASYQKSAPVSKNECTSNYKQETDAKTGAIPFSLFTATEQNLGAGSQYLVTDYILDFEEPKSTVESSGATIYTYESNATPYILLSSKQSPTDNFYATTLFFSFNDENFTSSLGNTVVDGSVSYSATVTTLKSSTPQQIQLESFGTSDNSLKINLKDTQTEPESASCPKLRTSTSSQTAGYASYPNQLLGDIYEDNNFQYNDTQFRVGKYDITITYNYATATTIENSCIFKISFYILDYANYTTSDMPISFENTDTYTYVDDETGETKNNYEIYNYNYDEMPKVSFDASKFGLNFTYTVKDTNKFNFKHQSFVEEPNADLKEVGQKTGTATIICDKLGEFQIPTYKGIIDGEESLFVANFDIKEFEKQIVRNNQSKMGNSSICQGIFDFDLDLLIKDSASKNYDIINKELLDAPAVLSDEHLVIFGYMLMYKSDRTNDYEVMANEDTHANIASFNDLTEGETEGYFANLPDYIASTNYPELYFFNYGNLNNDNKAKFILTPLADLSAGATTLNNLKQLETEEDFEAVISKVKDDGQPAYTQGSPVDGQGVWFMEMDYSLYLKDINKSIGGKQYFLFEINHNVQLLDTHAVNDEGSEVYTFSKYTNQNVLVAIEEKRGAFLTKTSVTYTLSSNFSNTPDLSGALTLKLDDDGNPAKYCVKQYDENTSTTITKYYNYYVTSNTKNYTFGDNIFSGRQLSSGSGLYTITIKEGSSSKQSVQIIIDKNNISNVKVNTVDKNDGGSEYYKTTSEIAKTNGLYVTNKPFTLSWQPKLSGAKSYCYHLFMPLRQTDEALSLFRQSNNDYWLTNGYEFGEVIKNDETKFENSWNKDYVGDNYLSANGLYAFIIYDDAGNYTTELVLLDNSPSGIMQGYFEGEVGNSPWINSFDTINNAENYVQQDTTLYFGTHKALPLDNLLSDTVFINLSRIKSCYDINADEIKPTPKIEFNLLNKVDTLTSFVGNSGTCLTSYPTVRPQSKFLVLRNTALTYSTTGETIFETQNGDLTNLSSIKIYRTQDAQSSRSFFGEADYVFTIKNVNGVATSRLVSMNFDGAQGTFYAHGSEENSSDVDRYILQNSGTNLNLLKFVYKENTSLSNYFKVESVSYKYFPFALGTYSSSFPFTTTPETTKTLTGDDYQVTTNGTIKTYSADLINVTNSQTSTGIITKPGKYVFTRTYIGGPKMKDAGGNIVNTGTGKGGDYDENNEYIYDLDKRVREYTVVVDHNGIITEMAGGQTSNRDVGDLISLTLNNTIFKEFFKESNEEIYLKTNKVPVTINIPVSKYVIYDEASKTYKMTNAKFAKLDVKVVYQKDEFTKETFVADGYNQRSLFVTCSALPSGTFTFKDEGTYTIFINDHTGYTDTTATEGDITNLEPKTFEYKFVISHSAPEAEVRTVATQQSTGIKTDVALENIGSDNKFATNISANGNELYVKFVDPRTPYNAKINLITISRLNGTPIVIDLTKLNKSLLDIVLEDNGIVDLSTFTGSEYINYLLVTPYYAGDILTKSEIYDNETYYRFSYFLSLNLENETTYTVKLSYNTLDNTYYTEFGEATYVISIDRTKPNTNINTLLNSESFLYNTTNGYYTPEELNNFKEENFDISKLTEMPSSFTYTFGVSKDFRLNYNSNETLPYFYVRSYNKYNGGFSSITPDMIETVYGANKAYYNGGNVIGNYPFAEYPKFSETRLTTSKDTWYRVNYDTQKTLSEIIESQTTLTPNGYFEIIERDLAGNYRCYTVYLNRSDNKTDDVLNIAGYDTDNSGRYSTSYTGNEITANNFFRLTEMTSKFGWGKVVLKNETLGNEFSKVLTLSPFTNGLSDEDISLVNAYFEQNQSVNSKFSVSLLRHNSAFPATVQYINVIVFGGNAKLPAPRIEEVNNVATGGTTYNLVLPEHNSTSVIYLVDFRLQIRSGDTWTNVPTTVTNNRITNLREGGVYKIFYRDNYNEEEYSYILYIGAYHLNEKDTMQFEFGSNAYIYDEATNTYYIGGYVDITYESGLYNVYVNVNNTGNQKYTGTNKENPSLTFGNYNCNTFRLDKTPVNSYDGVEATSSVGGIDTYTVSYYDVTETSFMQKQVHFVIYSELPEINLTNFNDGNPIASTLFESSSQITSAIVSVDWGKLDGPIDELKDIEGTGTTAEQIVTVGTLYKKNEHGVYEPLPTLTRKDKVQNEGYYRLDITNNILKNTRSVYFVIQMGNFPLYTVMANGEVLNPSKYENFSLALEINTALTEASGEAQQLMKVLKFGLGKLQDELSTVVDQRTGKTEYDMLLSDLGFKDGVFNISNKPFANVTNVNHFYSTVMPNIVYNNNMELNIVGFEFKQDLLVNQFKIDDVSSFTVTSNDNVYHTVIYIVYSMSSNNIRMEIFAVTKVPQNKDFLGDTLSYTLSTTNIATKTGTDPKIMREATEFSVPYNYIKNSAVMIGFTQIPFVSGSANAKWFNQGNYVYVTDEYGVNTISDELEIIGQKDGKNYVLVKGSGDHKLTFHDLAGNAHYFIQSGTFGSSPTVLKLKLIDQIIYNIEYNDVRYNPIQYGVFNDSVTVCLDENYLRTYTINPIFVTFNGMNLNSRDNENGKYFEQLSSSKFKFKKEGKYSVQLTGIYEGNTLTSTFNFSIISSHSSREAFEFVQTADYTITKVVKNSIDVTNNFKDGDTLTSIFLACDSVKSGNGDYTVYLKYGNLASSPILPVSFKLSDFIPTIACNVKHGETSTANIVITYNTNLIYSQLGRCTLVISIYNKNSGNLDFYGQRVIDETTLTESGITSLPELTAANSYFVQLKTDNGNVISSFRVNKKDPLNTFAIIVIVVAAIAVVALVIIIIKLRTRMKIR